jgi:uncharacterized protein YcnI
MKRIKNRKLKVVKYGIWLWSEIANKYAPTHHGLKDSREEATSFARKTLKLPENLGGKSAFEVRSETVLA